MVGATALTLPERRGEASLVAVQVTPKALTLREHCTASIALPNECKGLPRPEVRAQWRDSRPCKLSKTRMNASDLEVTMCTKSLRNRWLVS